MNTRKETDVLAGREALLTRPLGSARVRLLAPGPVVVHAPEHLVKWGGAVGRGWGGARAVESVRRKGRGEGTYGGEVQAAGPETEAAAAAATCVEGRRRRRRPWLRTRKLNAQILDQTEAQGIGSGSGAKSIKRREGLPRRPASASASASACLLRVRVTDEGRKKGGLGF
jgi:hypothetical protein